MPIIHALRHLEHRVLTFADGNMIYTVKSHENFEELRSVIINAVDVKRVAGVLSDPSPEASAREFGRSRLEYY